MELKKPWQGRFEKPTLGEVEQYTESLSFDWRLYRYDILGSVAHCKMLAECGIITHEEASQIIEALGEVQREIERGEFTLDPSFEDIHMAIEHRLIQKIGDVGGKLHTARSRNDQIALDMRLYLRDVILSVREGLLNVIEALLKLAKRFFHVVMPGYTHLQHAQPVAFSHHLMAYCEMFRRDEERFCDCLKRVNIMPLGSAALAGTSFPIDMSFTARYLKFDSITRNSMDSVSDRDYLLEFLSASAITMMHVSRLAEEIILWSSSEFGFIELSDAFCTGSSIMPQKKNPDVAELMRGKTGRVYGNLMALLTILKALPLTYNRDLQEDKIPVFDTADTLLSTLKLLSMMLLEIKVKEERMEEAAKTGWILATELADYLVTKGVPFRKAHHIVGQIVKFCMEEGKDFEDLTIEEFRRFHRAFDETVFNVLDLRKAVDRRKSQGGTSWSRIKEVLEITEDYLKEVRHNLLNEKSRYGL
ncbi:MAG: argininosuccinate lyase [Syntrophobacterales bacterium]|nr:argininosuccinate lyase [Syntrophobacterales bacterium]